jgi:MFS transporter, DHA2 family, multidrug resistance protein
VKEAAALHGQFDPANRALLMIGVMAATIMQILDTTIANVAIPHMQSSLGATVDTITWVLTSYIIASAVAIPITGWLADQIGSRRLFLIAVGGFILSSMACGAAANLQAMVLFRLAQGVFAAFIGPLGQSVMLDINPPEKHGRAMAIWGMGIMIGPIMGPVLGGWLTDNYSWRWVFYVNAPIGVLTFALLWALLPTRDIRKRRFDLFGFSMLAIGLASLQLMLDRGAHLDWFDSWEIIIEAGIAMSALWMFVVQMFTSRNPLFERAMLTDRNLMASLGFMVVIGIVMFASMALLPPMLQRLFGYPVIDTGLILSLRGIGILISMGFAGRMLGKIDSRILVGTGLSITAISLWQMSGWSLQMDARPVLFSGLIQGLGMGLVFIPLNTMAFATIGPKHRTDGASLLNLFRSLGASMGISIVTTLLGVNIQASHADLAGHVTAISFDVIDPGTADRFGPIGDAALRITDIEVNRQAFMIAYIDDFWAMMWVTALAIPLVLLLRPAKLGTKPPTMAE